MKSLVSANLLICNDMLDLCQQDGDITHLRCREIERIKMHRHSFVVKRPVDVTLFA